MSVLASFLRRVRRFEWTPNRVWIAIFAFWLFMLSGVTQPFGFGSPGILQFARLRSVLSDRQSESAEIDAENSRIESEAVRLETSPVVQEREIRRTMGYVGENEMIFDFSLSTSSALRRQKTTEN